MFLIVPITILVIFLVAFVVLPHMRMARRARALLAQHPNAERTSIYLPLQSTFAWQKRAEIDAKIAEMSRDGWTFLRATEGNPFRTIRSWGGGLTLQFIRAAP